MVKKFKVKINLGINKGDFVIKVKKEKDGWYADLGDGFELYNKNNELKEKTIRQLINKEYNYDYGGNPEDLNL